MEPEISLKVNSAGGIAKILEEIVREDWEECTPAESSKAAPAEICQRAYSRSHHQLPKTDRRVQWYWLPVTPGYAACTVHYVTVGRLVQPNCDDEPGFQEVIITTIQNMLLQAENVKLARNEPEPPKVMEDRHERQAAVNGNSRKKLGIQLN